MAKGPKDSEAVEDRLNQDTLRTILPAAMGLV